jgi:para-nitrobenzyl esterase
MTRSSTTRRAVLTQGISASFLLSLTYSLSAKTPELSNSVETSTGNVRGRRSRDVSAFLGIPYGTDTSTHRFQPARAPAPWAGVRDCFAIGHQAPQMEPSAGANVNMNSDFVRQLLAATREGMEVGNEGEDCLVLNVYTPDASRKRKRPVMFWMHGGGFAIGSAGDPQYSGAPLARRGDVVVVTVNHRLNALGYLYLGALHDDFADSGNVGQLDLILALQWVHDNIEAFGGDPGNVLIFGESGGGAKVSATLAMPPAHGLFHKAVIQSGPGLKALERTDAASHAERTLAALGVATADVHRLQSMDYRQIIQAAAAAQANAPRGTGGRSLSPIVDGRSLPRHPFDPDAPEISRDIPLMIGTCKDEGTLFMAADPMFGHMTEEQARARFNAMLGEKGPAAFDVYKSLRPNESPTYWLAAMSTGIGTWMNSIRLAERKVAQQGAPVYMFRLDWEPSFLDGVLRTPHGTDVPLVFDTVDARRLELGPGPEPRQVAASMSQAWISFARSGNPSQRGLAWPTYDAASRKTMIFNTTSHVASDPDGAARALWSA